MDAALLEKLSVGSSRGHVVGFMKDFDKSGLKRIQPQQAVRAICTAKIELTPREMEAVKEAYTGPDGAWDYMAFAADVEGTRPVGFFETQPNVDPAMTSPKARFAFSGVCSPNRMRPRQVLSEREEAELERIFKEIRYEASATRSIIIATLMKPFDAANRGSVTTARFTRQMLTHFNRLTGADVALLAKAYEAPDDCVRYSALSRDATPDLVNDGMPRATPGSATKRAASPNVWLERSQSLGASGEETRAGFRVLLRVLHERRIRVGDVFRDYGSHSPFPGKITRAQMVRALSQLGLPGVEPRVVEAIAATYSVPGEGDLVDYVAATRDMEATDYLRGLESEHPDTMNATFSREVAASPNPRFLLPTLSEAEEAALREVLGRMTAQAKRDRVLDARSFVEQFDRSRHGFISEDRFLRCLAMLKLLPELPADVELLKKWYRCKHDAKLLDYKRWLADCELN